MEESHKLREKVGQQLKQAPKNAKLTYTQLSEISGVSRSTLCQIENGVWSASVDMLEKIIEPLNLDLNIEEKTPPE
jgi:transcriptional regulator with XRE-family HTH domain